jgi:hypothetical protein
MMNIFKKPLKQNVKQLPATYYAKHITPGVVQYFESGKAEMLLIELDTLKNMNPSFKNRPVYVRHVDDVNLETLQEDAAGYVVESFYNQLDGAMWARMIIVSDEGHQAVQAGWAVSNSYLPRIDKKMGTWHNVDYDGIVSEGEYNHLALVPNPRYEEAVILSEEDYKSYNAQKEAELKSLQNSKENKMSIYKKMISLIMKAEAADKTVNNEADPKEEEEKLNQKFKVGEVEVSVRDLLNCYIETAKKNAEAEELKKKEEESKKNAEAEEAKKKEEEAKKNADAKAKEEADAKDAEIKKNAVEADAKAKADAEAAAKAKIEADENFKKLAEAEKNAPKLNNQIETSMEKVERGNQRYGSNK